VEGFTVSPVIVARKGDLASPEGPGPGKESAGLGGKDGAWIGVSLACTWLLLTGLHRLFSANPLPNAQPPVEVINTPAVPPPEPLPRAFIMHDEAVRLTVEELRKRAIECPDAPDVLSEEQIKAIERDGALLL
jgi:hypothetical protein